MSHEREHEPAVADPDRLNGWKDIAAYLGKGVRTAQRWERHYGLPVKRLGREGGEVIFASRREIADWLSSEASRRAASSAEPEPQSEPSAQAVTTAPVPAAGLIWSRIGVATILLLAAGVAAWTLWPQTAPQPSAVRVEADRFVVSDSRGRDLWHYAPGHPLRPHVEAWQAGHGSATAAVVDLDGDGTREVVVAAGAPDRNPAMAFHLLNADGSARRIIRPTARHTVGTETFSGPWIPLRLFLGQPRNGQTPLYLVFVDTRLFPTLLLEVTPQGEIISEYFSNGYVSLVAELEWKGIPTLFVGAANNETKGASLAIFPGGRALGSARSVLDVYRCHTCQPGGPQEFLVFPRRCISAADNVEATIAEAVVDNEGQLAVRVSEGRMNDQGHPESQVWYVMDASLTPLRAEATMGLRREHDRRFKEGLIDHALSPERDGPDLFPVRRWQDGTWVALPAGEIVW